MIYFENFTMFIYLFFHFENWKLLLLAYTLIPDTLAAQNSFYCTQGMT